ncbi:HEAT repeat domain-containing protein [candidate division KSB1 bacterium]|nr:HEAT repeat domain-containing protein [candidate division KSB1 bacterium]
MRKALALFVFLLMWGCQSYDKEFQEILQLEDRRAPVAEFQKFTLHPRWEVKQRVALALGRLREAEAAPTLVELLSSSSPEVRVEAAFALGQLAQPFTHKAIIRLLSEEKDLEVRLTLIEALGKVTVDSLPQETDSTLMRQFEDDIPIVRAEAALVLARLAQRNIKPPLGSEKLVALLQDKGEEVRWRAAYALMRRADSSTAPALRSALNDRSPRVRMQAARALGAMHDFAALNPLTHLAHNDNDWRVRVNAAAALGKLDFSRGALALQYFPVADVNQHVRITALQALGNAVEQLRKSNVNFESEPVRAFLQERLTPAAQNGSGNISWQEKAAAAHALAQFLQSEVLPLLLPLASADSPHLRAALANTLGSLGGEDVFPVLEKLAGDSLTVVRIAALEALSKISAQNRALPIYLDALHSGDPVLFALGAQALAADSVRRAQHAEAILAAHRTLHSPFDAETAKMFFDALADCGSLAAQSFLETALQTPDKSIARAAAEALRKLTGKDYTERLPKSFTSTQTFTYEEIKSLKGAWAEIKTDRGAFQIALFPEEAPLTVLSFVRLAQKKFFDGQTIHRVVPNFVMQSGDPRGDGWGGPDYAIRSEFNRLRYVRGMVGMASAGPDTEGSQWFITHSDQPHLDGRYTIFGRVRKGLEVVEELQIGNRILQVTIHQ